MPIAVLCPKCHARFQVSEKFAGKQGPCPKCKTTITVPKLEDEVKIHTPQLEPGAKDSKGRPVFKPIEREETKVQPVAIVGIVLGTLMVFGLAFLVGRTFKPPSTPPLALLAIGLLVVSPPLVYGAYSVLHEEELEPYRGQALLLRIAVCAAVYASMWLAFGFLNARIDEPILWVFYAPPFVIVGTLTALATLDLEFGSAFFHYAFYLGVTILLRLAIGPPLLQATTATALLSSSG